MPKRLIPLTELVPLWRRMTSREWVDGRLCGKLTVDDDELAKQLRELLSEENADDYPCMVEEGDPEGIRVGDVLHLRFGAVRTGVGLLAPNVDALLRNSHVAAGIAEHGWYVHAIDAASWEGDKDLCRRLALVRRLVHALEGAASIFDHRAATLIFLKNGGRFDVPIRYTERDLLQMDEQAAEQFIAQLELDDGHASQRHEIGSTAVCELLAAISREGRFAELLRRIDELNRRFVDGYGLFASSFSYEKLRDEAEALRIEYSGRIHKTISDIQGQLLGIPISTIVIATQFKPSAQAAGQAWVNLAIVFGAVLFFFLFLLAVWNQWQTLSVIDMDVDRHEAALRKDNSPVAERLKDVFDALRRRTLVQRVILSVAVALCFLGLCVGFAVYQRVDGA